MEEVTFEEAGWYFYVKPSEASATCELHYCVSAAVHGEKWPQPRNYGSQETKSEDSGQKYTAHYILSQQVKKETAKKQIDH